MPTIPEDFMPSQLPGQPLPGAKSRRQGVDRRRTLRGDKVIPLDERLADIEKSILILHTRVDRVAIYLFAFLGITHGPAILVEVANLIRTIQGVTGGP